MPKFKPDDIAAHIIGEEKNKRQILQLHKKQLTLYDIERDRMNKEFEDRQAMHLQFIEDDKKHHAQRLANHERIKEGVVMIVMKLEGEIAEDLDVGNDGVVITLPQLPAPEPRRPRERKPTLAERMGIKKVRA